MRALDHLLAWSALCATAAACAQVNGRPDSTQRDTYALVLYAGGGATLYPAAPGTPAHLMTRTTSIGPSAFARLMWLPDHRLRVGFESGWTTVYSYTIE